jgi:hypothetical protein
MKENEKTKERKKYTYNGKRRKTNTNINMYIHRVIQKFPELPISIQGNDIPSISLHHIFKIVVVIFHGKFQPFNSLLRYHFEVNNIYKVDLLGYYPC